MQCIFEIRQQCDFYLCVESNLYVLTTLGDWLACFTFLANYICFPAPHSGYMYLCEVLIGSLDCLYPL